MRYLLDTNIFVAVMNNRSTIADQRIIANRPFIVLSSLVMHELFYGAFRSSKIEHNLGKIDALGLPVLSFDAADAREAGRIRAQLANEGRSVGPVDVMIAGQAMARDLILVTANRREFDRVQGLRVEDWTSSA